MPAEPTMSERVFISSTYRDNEERRKIVEDAIQRAGMMPLWMERFTASARPTVEECLEAARDCDVYVGIVAHRYGWIPDGHDLAITELEYDAAKVARRPRLMFEIDPKTPIVPDEHLDPGPDRWKKQEKLEAFRTKYRADQMATPFTDDRAGRQGPASAQQLARAAQRACEPEARRRSGLGRDRRLPRHGRESPLDSAPRRLQDPSPRDHRSRGALRSAPGDRGSSRRGRDRFRQRRRGRPTTGGGRSRIRDRARRGVPGREDGEAPGHRPSRRSGLGQDHATEAPPGLVPAGESREPRPRCRCGPGLPSAAASRGRLRGSRGVRRAGARRGLAGGTGGFRAPTPARRAAVCSSSTASTRLPMPSSGRSFRAGSTKRFARDPDGPWS